MNRLKNIVLCVVTMLLMVAAIGCEKSGQSIDADYGYVQFKVVKNSALATRTAEALEWMADACKITVVMQHEGSTIQQTLPLSSYDKETAEWGLYSQKLRLMTGSYNIIGYYLYDNLDRELLVGDAAGEFDVTNGGLTVKEIGVASIERGKVSFVLKKEMTRSGEGEYLFRSIRSVDITVRNKFSQASTTFEHLPVTYTETFGEGSVDEDLYGERNHLTAHATCDTLVWLEAGNYTITGYTTYSDVRGKNRLESATVAEHDVEFTVNDNTTTRDIAVPVLLAETAPHIADYEALKEIWLALDGPNWTFHGEEYVAGANWDFNKDKDMWGEQPGVTLDGNGRVVTLNLSGFGARGVVPDAIGELTELRVLYLGNHNELIGGFDNSLVEGRIDARDYERKMLLRDGREGLSDELKRTINNDPAQPSIMSNRIDKFDVAFGNYTNGITAISRAVMRLRLLEQLFIANAPVGDDMFVDVEEGSKFYAESKEWSWGDFTNLTDVEIYNCPKLTRLPLELLTELPNIQSLNVALNRTITGQQLKSDWEAIIDGKSGATIQILYLGYNRLRETPSHDYLKRMTKLGLLDCTNNELEVVHPFGKEISPATIYLDNNRITELHAAEDGYFCGVSQMETFSCSGNLLTELPDIFTARSVYVMQTVNFSNNRIAALENGDQWRGVNSATLNLAGNRFTELPKRLIGSGSIVQTLMLGSNGMRKIEPGALKGANSETLTTIDLSYNRLTELPYDDFSASNLPYLYGIDLSSNAFEEFPYAPLSINALTVMSIRQQRDDEGNRTLREWPTGIGQCPRMAAFYIGSNDLRKIEDTISPYILLFEIKDNPNISIDLSSVCPYIEMGYYELIYDSTQDIRGCDALNLD